MATIAAAAASIGGLGIAPAVADGPSGSTEHDAEGEFTNQVECPDGEDADPSDGSLLIGLPFGAVFVGVPVPSAELPEDVDLGVELCSDDEDSLPVDGRVIVGAGAGPLTNPGEQPIAATAAVDGDESNAEYADQAAGWARLDLNTRDGLVVRCGDDAGNESSMHPTPSLPEEPENNQPGDGQDGLEDCG